MGQLYKTLYIFIVFLHLVYGIGDFDYYDAFESRGNEYRGKFIGELATYHHQVRKLTFKYLLKIY